MSTIERGPVIEYEVVWNTGHIDRVKAHQVSHSGGSRLLFSDMTGGAPKPERVEFHGEFDGQWQLVLSAPMDEIATIRNVSVCGEGL